jgi:hypothetical protein
VLVAWLPSLAFNGALHMWCPYNGVEITCAVGDVVTEAGLLTGGALRTILECVFPHPLLPDSTSRWHALCRLHSTPPAATLHTSYTPRLIHANVEATFGPTLYTSYPTSYTLAQCLSQLCQIVKL